MNTQETIEYILKHFTERTCITEQYYIRESCGEKFVLMPHPTVDIFRLRLHCCSKARKYGGIRKYTRGELEFIFSEVEKVRSL